MKEGRGEAEDDLIDLNIEPVARKRKRVENNSTVNGNERSEGLPKVVGRVLRSRTMAMTDGEKQVIKMEIVKMEDKDENEVPVSQKRKKMKGRRGRPPKSEGRTGISSLSFRKKDDKVMERKKIDDTSNEAGRGMQKVKLKKGRPRKMENGNTGIVIEKKRVKGDSEKPGNYRGEKRIKVGTNDLSNGIIKQKKGMVECAEGKETGLREQKQLVRDQIVAMLKKAGWTIEHRQRQSKDYQDAVYVDQEGRTHWSVTLAYKKFKEKINEGKADDKEVSAFSLISEETLSMLYRVTEKGKKAGKRKKAAGKSIKKITKKESSKSQSLDRRIKSRLNGGKRRTLLARRRRDGLDSDGYKLNSSLLSWMIDLGTVPLGGKVKYKGGSEKVMLEGRISRDGICCHCCNLMHTIQDFEFHAEGTFGKLYQHIHLESGNSLLRCLVDSWNKHMETAGIGFVYVDVDGGDPNDDTCNICGDGGDLICCDSCPATFHHGCLRIKVPSGDWHCVYCSCKFCGMNDGNTSTTDQNHDLLLSELFTCRLCEDKFHLHCIEGKVAEDFDSKNLAFCGKKCLKIYKQLRDLCGVRHELEERFSYTLLQHCNVSSDASLNVDCSKVESNSKLAVAFTVMDECFESIIDERSGTNMIHNVVYNCGSNIRRLNYSGFYTIVLEKGDELVSAASIRIHGSQLAEMPFIGTCFMYRRQGMCSRLLTAIERVLCSLGVEKLIIPAISELNETWTNIFGFVPLEESKSQEMRYMSMIVFPGIDMLEKTLSGQYFLEGQMSTTECTEVKAEHQSMQENPTSDSSDLKIQNHNAAAAVESSANVPDASATESIEVITHRQNTQEEHEKDIRGLAAKNFNTSSEVNPDNKVAAGESGAIDQ